MSTLFSCSKSLVDILLGKTLYVSTYDRSRLILKFTSSGSEVMMHEIVHDKPLGGCTLNPDGDLVVSHSDDEMGVNGPHEICYLPAVFKSDRVLLVANPAKNEISAWDGKTLRRYWTPPKSGEGDCCHISGLCVDQKGLRLVTMFGESNLMSGWRSSERNSGIVMDAQFGMVLRRGLTMPHSPRLYRNRIWVCNSGNGELLKVGCSDNPILLPGITRGLDFHDDLAFVGLSRIRKTNVFSEMSLGDTRCGVDVIDITSGKILGSIVLHDNDEVFGVLIH